MAQQGGQAFCNQKLQVWAARTVATKDPCCETASLELSPEEKRQTQRP